MPIVERVTAWLLPVLDSHYGGFCLPVAWSRYLLPGLAVETRLESFVYATLVYVAAAAAHNLPQHFSGNLSFAPLIASVVWTYLFPSLRDCFLAGRRKVTVRTVLSTVALVLLAAAFAAGFTAMLHFYTANTFLFGATLAMGRCVLAFLDVLVSPTLSTSTRGGVFVAAVAVAIAGRSYLSTAAAHLFPYNELVIAFEAIEAVTQASSVEGQVSFRRAALELLVLTIHIQVAMGFVGIKYLREAQNRINCLLSVGPAQTHGAELDSSDATSNAASVMSGATEVVSRVVVGEEPLGFKMVFDSTRGCLQVESVHTGHHKTAHSVRIGDILVELNESPVDSNLRAKDLSELPRPLKLGFARPSIKTENGLLGTVAEGIPSVGSPTYANKPSGSPYGGTRDRLSSRLYGRHALWFVLHCALPYLGTRAVFAACQTAATSRFQTRAQVDFLKRLFEDQAPSESNFDVSGAPHLKSHVADISMTSTARLRAVSQSEYTVTAFSDAVVSTFDKSFNLVQRKIFSLPKLALFPGLFFARPTYIGAVFPLSVLLDYAKGKITGAMTARVRYLQKEAAALQSQQQRVYEHDLRHEEQIKLAGAAPFTRERWVALSQKASAMNAEAAVVEQSRRYLEWLYWSDILKVSIEVLLAALLEGGTMTVGEVWVNSRVLEDAMDILMSRARVEADLSSIATDVDKLTTLTAAWQPTAAVVVNDSLASEGNTDKTSEKAPLVSLTRRVPCAADPSHCEQPKNGEESTCEASAAVRGELRLPAGLGFQRGGTVVRVGKHGVSLKANGAIVAVTGANGSGKSTTFALLAAAECASQPVDLPESIRLLLNDNEPSGITLPGPSIITLSQTPYHPLFVKPLDWFLVDQNANNDRSAYRSSATEEITNTHDSQSTMSESGGFNATEAEWASATRIASMANELKFYESMPLNASTLLEVQDNWFGSLSGGQRAKADFIRSVFSRPSCPSLLLVDEGFAALDPTSKALVHAKLKAFCPQSLVLCIYHTDSAAMVASSDSTKAASSGGNSSDTIEHEGNNSREDNPESTQNHGCLSNSGFFDANLHFEGGTVQLRPLCGNVRGE